MTYTLCKVNEHLHIIYTTVGLPKADGRRLFAESTSGPRKLSVNPVVLCFIQIFRGGLGHCSRGR